MKKVKVLLSRCILGCLLVAMAGAFQACAPVLFAGGATAIGMAAEDQGIDGSISDKSLKVDLKTSLAGFDMDAYGRIDINVLEGNVLLTGYLESQEKINEVVEIVEGTAGVRYIFNELQVGEEQGIGGSASDAWTSGFIRTELFLTGGIRSANYLVHITDGTVYLMGVAKDQEELDQVLEIIQDSSGIKQIINMTRFKDQPLQPRRKGKQKEPSKKVEVVAKSPLPNASTIEELPLDS